MKKLLAILLLLVTLFVVVQIRVKKSQPQTEAISENQSVAIDTNRTAYKTSPLGSPNSSTSQFAGPISDRETTVRQVVEAQNAPVSFFATVVDQNRQPVSGATVELSVRHWRVDPAQPFNPQGPSIRFKKKTDGNGAFNLTEVTGDVVALDALTKDGYELEPSTQRTYSPSEHHALNPIILRMWKKVATEETIQKSLFSRMIPDSRTYTVDLAGGKQKEGLDPSGDFSFLIQRPADVGHRDTYAWSFSISPISGGLLKCEGPFHYEAPDEGYLPKYSETLTPANGNWTDRVKRDFFVTSKNGRHFAHVNFDIFAYYDKSAAIQVRYVCEQKSPANAVMIDGRERKLWESRCVLRQI